MVNKLIFYLTSNNGLFKYHAIGRGGRRGYPKCSLSLTRGGGRGGTVNDHLIMIMHWGGGGRSHNDHLITLLIFGLELQKRANLYILCLIWDSNMFLHSN